MCINANQHRRDSIDISRYLSWHRIITPVTRDRWLIIYRMFSLVAKLIPKSTILDAFAWGFPLIVMVVGIGLSEFAVTPPVNVCFLSLNNEGWLQYLVVIQNTT